MIVACTVALLITACHKEQEVVRVAVRTTNDPTKLYPLSKLYIASIANKGHTKLVFEAVQMPGGYVGSGVFFPCSVEKRNVTSKGWDTISRTELTQFVNPPIKEQEVNRGDEREVCRSLLPKEGASDGDCVRFRLSSRFGYGGDVFLSEPFTVNGKSDAVLSCTSL